MSMDSDAICDWCGDDVEDLGQALIQTLDGSSVCPDCFLDSGAD